jgi:hypothetical protein
MQYLSFLLMFFVSVCSALAIEPPPIIIGEYMASHSRVWNDGGVCRHAAAELAYLADDDNLEYRVPQFSTIRDNLYHVAFSVRYDDTWYHIDSVMDEPGRYTPHYRTSVKYSPSDQFRMFRALTGRPIVEYVGDVSDEKLSCWLNRCELTLSGRIDSQLEQVINLRMFLTKWEKVFRNYGNRNK